ncbi:nuclear transport factor 2 family protein [Actinotalea sp. M2MS4P-6]|uniref:nuclear transport factor 2 family protein n=1 Tax=Actinotalea sp. M2MS4P-6 TaxID=2983762 RepID=UPI0021E450E9|nr:nuclear transport factor 2 family protein [Actinotalea sp. M2MS4P-6]MCV2394070.1 nuclear transport factor 2 family protein [Actinotalea sp. M2MS4P-6]
MNALHVYLDGWRRNDVAAAVGVLTEACVLVDSSGTVLRGRDAVAEWMSGWFAGGGVVHDWQITDESVADGVITAQWVVHATIQGVEARVEGRTVAHLRDGAISYLRDYTTSTPLGDWDGTWAG